MEKIILIVGPTGVGKTSLSIQLAKKFDTEIISGDSMQVYREMSVGTAKVTPEEMQGVKHHLIDYCSYKDDFNVMIFQKEARKIIHELVKQHKIPIICGGTGLYIKSLYYDYEFNDEEKDEDFEAFLKSRSEDECWNMLRIVDPASLEKIHKNNRKRVERALMRAHMGNKKSEAEERQNHQPIFDAFVIGLTADRNYIYQRIDERVDVMMNHHLLEEVSSLITSMDDFKLQSLQGIGYKEWEAYFKKEATVEETVALIKKNSRNFAKRQYTWFNHQMKVHWYDITQENFRKQIEQDLEEWRKESIC